MSWTSFNEIIAYSNDVMHSVNAMFKKGQNGKVNWLDNAQTAGMDLFGNAGATSLAMSSYRATGNPLALTAKYAAGNDAGKALTNTAQTNYQLWQMYQPRYYDNLYMSLYNNGGYCI